MIICTVYLYLHSSLSVFILYTITVAQIFIFPPPPKSTLSAPISLDGSADGTRPNGTETAHPNGSRRAVTRTTGSTEEDI